MKISILLSFLLLAVVGAGGGFWWWTVGSIPMPVRLCEKRIIEVLKSPASYQRANFHYIQTTQEYNRDEYINAEMEIDRYKKLPQLLGIMKKYDPLEARKKIADGLTENANEAYKKLGLTFTKVLVGVDFDSKNPMGVLLRSSAYCKWVKLGTGSDTIAWTQSDADEAGLLLATK